jgi:hypothetical protein
MTVKPGFGFEHLHLRGYSDLLIQRFGPPKKRRESGSLREYWMYPDQHFDCIVSKKTGLILSLFLHAGNPLGAAELFGASEDRILQLYRSPSKEGGGQTLMTGDFVGRWLTYDEGIGFDFGPDSKLRTVSIFAPKQKVKAKLKAVSATHREQSELIAALRLG